MPERLGTAMVRGRSMAPTADGDLPPISYGRGRPGPGGGAAARRPAVAARAVHRPPRLRSSDNPDEGVDSWSVALS
jgi:hypothetical protein